MTKETSSQKTLFFAGVGAGIGIAALIGFFVLLGIVLNKNTADTSGEQNRQAQQQQQEKRDQAQAQPTSVDVPLPTSDDHTRGDTNAEIAIIEYSDIDCPFCKQIHSTLQQIVEEYPGKVKWVYRHFPLAGLHPDAPKKAEATECVAELGGKEAFWKFLDNLFETEGETMENLPAMAKQAGVDADAFSECLNSGKYAQKVRAQYNEATAAGGRGTPYSIIVKGDKKIPVSGARPLSYFKNIIDQL